MYRHRNLRGMGGGNTLSLGFALRSKKIASDLKKKKQFSFILPIFLLPSSSCCCSRDHTFLFPLSRLVLKNPLMSSSHLRLGLPTGLRVLILLSSPGCQSKIFLVHLFLPFSTSIFCAVQSSKVLHFLHVFFGFLGTSFDVFNPSSFSVV